jgi:hypothetical protein
MNVQCIVLELHVTTTPAFADPKLGTPTPIKSESQRALRADVTPTLESESGSSQKLEPTPIFDGIGVNSSDSGYCGAELIDSDSVSDQIGAQAALVCTYIYICM